MIGLVRLILSLWGFIFASLRELKPESYHIGTSREKLAVYHIRSDRFDENNIREDVCAILPYEEILSHFLRGNIIFLSILKML